MNLWCKDSIWYVEDRAGVWRSKNEVIQKLMIIDEDEGKRHQYIGIWIDTTSFMLWTGGVKEGGWRGFLPPLLLPANCKAGLSQNWWDIRKMVTGESIVSQREYYKLDSFESSFLLSLLLTKIVGIMSLVCDVGRRCKISSMVRGFLFQSRLRLNHPIS